MYDLIKRSLMFAMMLQRLVPFIRGARHRRVVPEGERHFPVLDCRAPDLRSSLLRRLERGGQRWPCVDAAQSSSAARSWRAPLPICVMGNLVIGRPPTACGGLSPDPSVPTAGRGAHNVPSDSLAVNIGVS